MKNWDQSSSDARSSLPAYVGPSPLATPSPPSERYPYSWPCDQASSSSFTSSNTHVVNGDGGNECCCCCMDCNHSRDDSCCCSTECNSSHDDCCCCGYEEGAVQTKAHPTAAAVKIIALRRAPYALRGGGGHTERKALFALTTPPKSHAATQTEDGAQRKEDEERNSRRARELQMEEVARFQASVLSMVHGYVEAVEGYVKGCMEDTADCLTEQYFHQKEAQLHHQIQLLQLENSLLRQVRETREESGRVDLSDPPTGTPPAASLLAPVDCDTQTEEVVVVDEADRQQLEERLLTHQEAYQAEILEMLQFLQHEFEATTGELQQTYEAKLATQQMTHQTEVKLLSQQVVGSRMSLEALQTELLSLRCNLEYTVGQLESVQRSHNELSNVLVNREVLLKSYQEQVMRLRDKSAREKALENTVCHLRNVLLLSPTAALRSSPTTTQPSSHLTESISEKFNRVHMDVLSFTTAKVQKEQCLLQQQLTLQQQLLGPEAIAIAAAIAAAAPEPPNQK